MKDTPVKTFFTYFPTPEYLSLSAPGMVISDDAITFIAFKRALFTGTLRLDRYHRVALPEGVVRLGLIANTERLVSTLKEFSGRFNLSHVRAILPEEKAYLFTANIDRVPPEGLRDAVAFILEENVPIPLSESVFYFDVIESTPDSAQIKVIVSVLPQKVATDYLTAFSAAGLTPVAFDIESQAIARAIVPKGDEATQLIINLEGRKTGFYIVEDEVVQFSTTLPFNIGKHVGDLKTEMHKIFAFWGARQTKIEKALLCGSASIHQSVVDELMSECPVPHTFSTPWANLATGTETLPKDLLAAEQDYVAAIGSALSHH